MSFFHRALLYVVRKRVRSLLLLLICLGVQGVWQLLFLKRKKIS